MIKCSSFVNFRDKLHQIQQVNPLLLIMISQDKYIIDSKQSNDLESNKKQSLFKSIYFILVNLETCLSERLKNYLFKLFQGDLPVAISINHFHVRLNVLFSRFVNLPHFLISLLKNERYLILSQKSWSIFIKLLEKSSYNIQTFLGQWCQISSFNILWTLSCNRNGTFVLILR